MHERVRYRMTDVHLHVNSNLHGKAPNWSRITTNSVSESGACVMYTEGMREQHMTKRVANDVGCQHGEVLQR